MIRRLSSVIACSSLFAFLLSIGPLRPYFRAFFNTDSPQLILVLGGDIDREHVGARLANDLHLPLVVSGGSNPEHANWLIDKSGLPRGLVRLDYRAKDTLGNFTSLVDDLSLQGFNHALLITSEDHLARAKTVGWVVAGSRGIRLTGLSVPCSPHCKTEHWRKHFFDFARSLAWVMTGKDVKELAKLYLPQAFGEI